MKVFILQHEDSTPPGSTLKWVESRGHSLQVLKASDISHWPSLEDFDLLVICGGGMNVDQEDRYPWLRQEKQLIQQSLRAGKKIVGLCLGAQLLAEALGARVGKHTDWEVGWHSVHLNNQEELKVFQWHGYSFDLPRGAELMASNSNCFCQAFTYESRVLAFQFHPETTKEWATECAEHPRLPITGWVQSREEIKRDIQFQPQLQSWYFSQLDQLSVK